jgi:hypothetical protein
MHSEPQFSNPLLFSPQKGRLSYVFIHCCNFSHRGCCDIECDIEKWKKERGEIVISTIEVPN